MAGGVREDADDIGEALDFGAEALPPVGAVDLRTVRLGARYQREHVGLGHVHQCGEIRELGRQLIGDDAPWGSCRVQFLLRGRNVDRRADPLTLSLAGMG